jgi:hypothetical protein
MINESMPLTVGIDANLVRFRNAPTARLPESRAHGRRAFVTIRSPLCNDT